MKLYAVHLDLTVCVCVGEKAGQQSLRKESGNVSLMRLLYNAIISPTTNNWRYSAPYMVHKMNISNVSFDFPVGRFELWR